MKFHRSATLTCSELVDLVTDYLEAALSPAQRRRFEAHIARCPDCPAHLDQMRLVRDLLGYLKPASLSAEAERELLAAFSDWRDERA
jgi:anti-sigma factor RsiW